MLSFGAKPTKFPSAAVRYKLACDHRDTYMGMRGPISPQLGLRCSCCHVEKHADRERPC